MDERIPRHDLSSFHLSDMVALGAALRRPDPEAGSIEVVAQRLVELLRQRLVDSDTGQASCVLARLYRTSRFGALDPAMQRFAVSVLQDEPLQPDTPCLTLLASTGDEPEWCAPENSRGHRVIPLPSAEIVSRLPMVSQLIRQFGLDLNDVVHGVPDLVLEPGASAFNVFHVETAEGSPYVPAQADFVVPYRVRSVLGFGGVLPGPDLFAVILFSRTPIPRATAELFRTVALSVKLALLPFTTSAPQRNDMEQGSIAR